MFSVRLKQTCFLHTVPMISKLTSKKVLNRPSVGCTHYPKPRCEFLDENLCISFIHPSKSAHGVPILFVKKKDGSLCLCVNFCSLNHITKKDCYLLPLISDLLDAPGRARIYMKIDLRHAYHLVQIADGNEEKTTFHMCYGLFEWLVILEGLTNAPTSFQRFMKSSGKGLLYLGYTWVDLVLSRLSKLSRASQDASKAVKAI